MKHAEWDFYAALGRQIRDARKAAGWRQEDLAAKLGCSRSSVANIESGRQVLSAYDLAMIHGLFGLEVDGLALEPGSARPGPAERRALVEENQRLYRQLGQIRALMLNDGESS